jgi:uncharacterized protein YndB with AHSA1/START domain/uncharacterized damage-inducible protein DinB
MGPGSLQATTTHIIGAMRRWTDVLASRPLMPRLDHDGVAYTPAQLLEFLNQSANDFKSVATSQPLDAIVIRLLGGKEFRLTRGSILTQVTTHGMHHRAQCLNMLRQLGVSPLPLSSVVEWTRSAESEGAATTPKQSENQTPAISIARVIDAPPTTVFDAWISPGDLAKWWGPREGRRDWTTPHAETNPTPGGAYRICVRSPRGEDHWMGGIYRQIDRPHQLAFTFAWEKEHNENSKRPAGARGNGGIHRGGRKNAVDVPHSGLCVCRSPRWRNRGLDPDAEPPGRLLRRAVIQLCGARRR